MREFFIGWRRKAGCGALLLALIVAVAWARSYIYCDELTLPHGQVTYFASSLQARVGCGWQTPSHSSQLAEWHSFNMTRMNVLDTRETCDLQVCWRWAGFRFESGTLKHQASRIEIEMWMVPYWSLVLPLTLISGYLILRQPSPSPVQRRGP
ncbi:MAG: hypothetical protein JWP89_1679 [Schlesneria sp.]|nr:hypothetical protein [Schlesneria sp.]